MALGRFYYDDPLEEWLEAEIECCTSPFHKSEILFEEIYDAVTSSSLDIEDHLDDEGVKEWVRKALRRGKHRRIEIDGAEAWKIKRPLDV